MAGDIGGVFSQKKAADQMAALPVPVLAVRGNSDRRRAEKILWRRPEVASLHFTKVMMGGLCLAGISGTVLLPFESRLRFRERSFQKRIGSFFQGVQVMVVHVPPRGVRDQVLGRFHAGSAVLREMVLRFQPAVVICGHIHECAGAAYLGETLVVNCSIGRTGAGALVDYSPGSRPKADFL